MVGNGGEWWERECYWWVMGGNGQYAATPPPPKAYVRRRADRRPARPKRSGAASACSHCSSHARLLAPMVCEVHRKPDELPQPASKPSAQDSGRHLLQPQPPSRQRRVLNLGARSCRLRLEAAQPASKLSSVTFLALSDKLFAAWLKMIFSEPWEKAPPLAEPSGPERIRNDLCGAWENRSDGSK